MESDVTSHTHPMRKSYFIQYTEKRTYQAANDFGHIFLNVVMGEVTAFARAKQKGPLSLHIHLSETTSPNYQG